MRIAVYYLARGMQVVGMPSPPAGHTQHSNLRLSPAAKLAARDIEGSARSHGTPSVASSLTSCARE